MKITDILTESSSSKLSLEEVKRHLTEGDYTEAFEQYKSGYTIYKGMPNMPVNDFGLLQPLSDRKSANTANYYTLIFNNDPRFNKFPKRSVICSGNQRNASDYANHSGVYIVFPKNGTLIASVPAIDMWGADVRYFENFSSPLYEWVLTLHEIYRYMTVSPNTYDDMLSAHEKFMAMSEHDRNAALVKGGISGKLHDHLMANGLMGMYELIEPELFFRAKISNLHSLDIEQNELWFDAPFIVVHENAISQIVQ